MPKTLTTLMNLMNAAILLVVTILCFSANLFTSASNIKSFRPFRLVTFLDSSSNTNEWNTVNNNQHASDFNNTGDLSVVIRIQPEGGATSSVNETLKTLLANVKMNRSAHVFAFIKTDGRTKSITSLQNEIDAVRSQYGDSAVDGFYIDNVVNASLNSSMDAYNYDMQLSTYIRTNASTTVAKLLFFNPRGGFCGSNTSAMPQTNFSSCLDIADFVVAFHGSLSEYVRAPSAWTKKNSWRQLGLPPTTTDNNNNNNNNSNNTRDRFAVFVTNVPNATAARSIIVNSFVTFNISLGCIVNDVVNGSIEISPPPTYFNPLVHFASRASYLQEQSQRRGAYAQLYATSSGDVDFTSNATWNETFTYILLNDTKSTLFLEQMQLRGFNSVSLYNLGFILDSATRRQRLRDLMHRGRKDYGIETWEAVAGSWTGHYDQIASFQNASVQSGNYSHAFDSLATEIEFWHSNNATAATAMIEYMRAKNPAPRFDNVPFAYSVYIGWLTDWDIRELVRHNVSRLYTHIYVTSPDKALSKLTGRVDVELDATLNASLIAENDFGRLCVTPLFAASGQHVKAGSEVFMGDWMQQNSPNAVGKAETIVMDGINSTWPAEMGNFCGFQWWSDFFVRVYAKDEVAMMTTSTTTMTEASMTSTSPAAPSSSSSSSPYAREQYPSATEPQLWEPAFIVPAYFFPSGSECGGSLGYWDCLIKTIYSSPAMFRGGIIIMNPNSGPGSSRDASYVNAIKAVRAAESAVRNKIERMFASAGVENLIPTLYNDSKIIRENPSMTIQQLKEYELSRIKVHIVGYTHVNYGNRNIATVLSDIAKYRSWYDIDGFFIDEASNAANKLSYFQNLSAEIRMNTTSNFIINNQGTQPEDEDYIDTANVTVIFETFFNEHPPLNTSSSASTWKRKPWIGNYSKSRYATLYHTVPSVTAMRDAFSQAHRHSESGLCGDSPLCLGKYLYVTDDDGALNPWDTLASWFPSQVAAMTRAPSYFSSTASSSLSSAMTSFDILGSSFVNSTAATLVRSMQAVDWLLSSNKTNIYKSGGSYLTLDGPTNSSASTQCATFTSLVMQSTFNYGGNYLYRWLNSSSPFAEDYYDAIVNGTGFLRIFDVRDVQVGDLVVMKYSDADESSNTGHVMQVVNVTFLGGEGEGGGAKAPFASNTSQWEIWVVDSSASFHGPLDTRKAIAPQVGGIGAGVARLYSSRTAVTDANSLGWLKAWNSSVPVFNETLEGYAWSMYSNSEFYNNSNSTRSITIGRPTFNYFFVPQPIVTTTTMITTMLMSTTSMNTTTMMATTQSSVAPASSSTMTSTSQVPTTASLLFTSTTTTTVATSTIATTAQTSMTTSTPTPPPISTASPSATSSTASATTIIASSSSMPSTTTPVPSSVTSIMPNVTTTTTNASLTTSTSFSSTNSSLSTQTSSSSSSSFSSTSTTASSSANTPTTTSSSTLTTSTSATTTSSPVPTTSRAPSTNKEGVLSRFKIVIRSARLRQFLTMVTVKVALLFDLARKLQTATTNIKIDLTIPPASSQYANDAQVTEVQATISGIDLAYLDQVATSLTNASSSSNLDWLIDTKTELDKLDPPSSSNNNNNNDLQILGASAQVETQTSPAPFSAATYCEEKLVICVAPPCAFVFLVLIVILVVKKRKSNKRAAIASVQETMAAQHTYQNKYFFSQSDGDASGGFHKFKDPEQQQQEQEQELAQQHPAAASTSSSSVPPPAPLRRTADPVPRQQRRLTLPPSQKPEFATAATSAASATNTNRTISSSNNVINLSDDDENGGSDLDIEAYLDSHEAVDL